MANMIDGTTGNDNLNGTTGVDVFIGSDGSDIINGGDTGYNQIDYDGAPSDYTFTENSDGTVAVTKPGGGVDTISNIGGFWFTGSAEWIPLGDLLGGNTGGTDNSGAGQIITGTNDDDYLHGTSGDDQINGGGGRDVINGSDGNDIIDGGDAGYNQIDYDGSSSEYTFELNDDGTVSVTKPDGSVDTISNIGGFWFKGDSVWSSLEDCLTGNPTNPDNTVNANNDLAETEAGKAVTIDVTANDDDPEGDSFSVSSFEDGENGVVSMNSDGDLVYTPKDGFSGDDWFSYTITDENGAEDTATVDVTVEEHKEVDLSINKTAQNLTASGREGFSNGAYSFDVVKFTVSVTNNSDIAATGVTVQDVTPENLDVWKDGDSLSQTETGQAWASNYWSAWGGSAYTGSPEYVDSTNGWVTIEESGKSQANDRAAVGQQHGQSEGSVLWELGTPIQPGETVTLEYYGMRDTIWSYDAHYGTEYETSAQIVAVDQWDTNSSNNTDGETVRWISPIALDLNGDNEIGVTGVTSSIEKDVEAQLGRTVEFDLDADGEMDTVEWFDGSGDGILVDTAKISADGSIDGSALFGDEGGKYANGYEKLEAHDVNGDGMVSGAELATLALWIDDGDAVLEDGEMQSADEAGIASISTDMTVAYDSEGRTLMQSTATTTEGQSILTEDVWFAEAADEIIDMELMAAQLDEDQTYCADCGQPKTVLLTMQVISI